MIQDLRQWLDSVDQLGELVCVDQPVDPIEEMGAVTYLVAKQSPSPAVLFERPAGFESSPIGARLLWNILGPSIRRTALTLEEPPDTPALELIRRVKDKMQPCPSPSTGRSTAGAMPAPATRSSPAIQTRAT